ncbi:pyrimidine dimer DNA glycosylase/endonuclease V [Pseudoclavibacter alba]|uniref:Pyrimidine dimer DNA glycosylase/endonuclease V n=1 Tax=Pseudoclavibacter albus TaxID=272241 RepID=A0ABT2HU45_9MICO|nr:pyrimidine dimer DNA glycosylase/endonuclease V [Pseudoclavibacter alba]MCT2041838.1 pyrimidine dimer DNA glycosylase/endonuclease V [Pseudoclavibacter alba]
MRLWSLHPCHLDAKGLVALWREALLAQAVLLERTRGYRNHPQLARFRSRPEPLHAIARYLEVVHEEAIVRGYRFDANKIVQPESSAPCQPITVATGQLAYEAEHLRVKLTERAPDQLTRLGDGAITEHPMFTVIDGPIADCERPNAAK